MYGIFIYANIWGILMVNVTIYGSTMDPMGYPDRIWFCRMDGQASMVPSWL